MHILDAIDEQLIERLLVERHFFWLDVVQPSDEQLAWMAERFGWHPLAVEDTQEFHQRPKLDRYGDHMLLVFYGAKPIDDEGKVPDEEETRRKLVEVHLLVSGNWVVTVRRDWCGALDDLRRRLREEHEPESESFVVYRILDALTDTFFPLLERIDDTIDALEDAIILDANDKQLQQVFQLKRGAWRAAAGRLAAARPGAARDRGHQRLARPRRRHARLLPRRLRPPDPRLRHGRLLPRPADRA